MPKKKTIPPPDDFSSEFMETESAKELSEQQVEAAGSDNTETPLAEPPEVDLGSGDVSGTTDVEENEPDAENTADAAEIVPVSDEKAENPEYDSILQELNSSTPAPLDSSGENSLDALLLEGNVENAPPAEDETESADGETAPQPTAPPAPAGRRDSYILTVDTLYNAIGSNPETWQDGEPVLRPSGDPKVSIYLTIPANRQPESFWPWREREIIDPFNARPCGTYYMECWDVYKDGVFQKTEYDILQTT